MQNDALAQDYLRRAGSRIRALGILMEERSWADVISESQEVVEIVLKALLRSFRIEVPRIHDVSPVLDEQKDRFPPEVKQKLDKMMRISKSLRRDLELAFYGSEDLTPSEFYTEEDASIALDQARWIYRSVIDAVEN